MCRCTATGVSKRIRVGAITSGNLPPPHSLSLLLCVIIGTACGQQYCGARCQYARCQLALAPRILMREGSWICQRQPRQRRLRRSCHGPRLPPAACRLCLKACRQKSPACPSCRARSVSSLTDATTHQAPGNPPPRPPPHNTTLTPHGGLAQTRTWHTHLKLNQRLGLESVLEKERTKLGLEVPRPPPSSPELSVVLCVGLELRSRACCCTCRHGAHGQRPPLGVESDGSDAASNGSNRCKRARAIASTTPLQHHAHAWRATTTRGRRAGRHNRHEPRPSAQEARGPTPAPGNVVPRD